MPNRPKIGFLSTIDMPLLPFMISSAMAHGVADIVVICDSKARLERDNELWASRTGVAFQKINGRKASPYLFGGLIPFHLVESHNGTEMLDLIRSLSIGCLLNAGTPRKLSSEILNAVKHGVVNLHPGLLPKYRGCSCVEWAILNDDPIGNTAHFMDEGYDSGPIITAETYEFSKDCDYQSIRTRVYRGACELAGRVLSTIQETGMTPSDALQQNEADAEYWNPITPDKMADVIAKTAAGSYRYQI